MLSSMTAVLVGIELYIIPKGCSCRQMKIVCNLCGYASCQSQQNCNCNCNTKALCVFSKKLLSAVWPQSHAGG